LSEARDLQRRWPKNATGFLAEANILQKQEKTAEAERTLRQALSQQPASSTLLAATVALLSKQGKTDAAEALATTWMREHPKDSVAPSLLAAQSMAVKDYPDAVRWYRAALDVAPGNAVILPNLAFALGQTKDRRRSTTRAG
jgi:Flp pilus assembly protein TadD